MLYQGKVLDGCHRYKACLKAGIEPRFEEFKGDDAAAAAFVVSKNIRRRHLTAKQKRELIAKLIKAAPEQSNRQIASAAHVDHKTVAAVRVEKQATGEIPQLKKTVGKDGKARRQPAKKRTCNAKKRTCKPRPAPAIKKIAKAAEAAAPDREAAARARQDIGPASTGEVERLRARVDELQAEKRQLEIKITGLESENAELKAENAELRVKLEAACTTAGGPPKNGGAFPTRCNAVQSTPADTRTIEGRAAAIAAKGVQEPIPDFLLRKPTEVVS
jgi:hypothetical protein